MKEVRPPFLINIFAVMRKALTVIILQIAVSGMFISSQPVNHWETAVFNNDVWRYFVGTSEPDQTWRELSFNDSIWLQGPGGFGYGDNDDNTVITPCMSVFIRIKINIPDTSAIGEAVLNMDYDDAFVAYLNGTEIARNGISGTPPAYNAPGTDHEALMYQGENPESFIIKKNILRSILLPGDNVLAVEVHNSGISSSDMSSNVFLSFGILNNSAYFRKVPLWFTEPKDFSSSNLPVVSITTSNGAAIPDEPKITADMNIIWNGEGKRNNVSDPGNNYSGKAGIEIRGSTSSAYPQKSYGFETRDSAGNNRNVALLGMPEENDWILLTNYNDKTFLRNFLAYDIFRKMGHYATRSRYCEVMLNNDYQGIYLLEEKIKQDRNRVDIATLNPEESSGDDVTGGYIFKNDYYTSSDSWLSYYSPLNKPNADVYFVYVEPKPDVIISAQKKYLKDYVDAFENTLYGPDYKDRSSGYKAYIDVNSFVDYFILSELTRNVDAYKKSRFYYKDKDSKSRLIHSGPPWDYDWAWKDITENCIHFNQTDGSGWAYKINECDAWPVPPSWEVRLMQDRDFVNRIHERYFQLRLDILSQSRLFHVIDSVAALLDEAQQRHFDKWKILGENVGTPEYGDQPLTYAGEIEKFKNWIIRRLNWLDANMPGKSSEDGDGYQPILRIFPVPAADYLYIETDTVITKTEIFNLTGSKVLEYPDRLDGKKSINISQLVPGLYFIRVYFSEGEVLTRRFLKK